MGQNYDTGGALRRPSEARTGTGTLFGRTMGQDAVTAGLILVAAPPRTTVRIPDALTALAAGTHGKLTFLLGDDR
jgi:hypothetical protein